MTWRKPSFLQFEKKKRITDGPTDGRTDPLIEVERTHLNLFLSRFELIAVEYFLPTQRWFPHHHGGGIQGLRRSFERRLGSRLCRVRSPIATSSGWHGHASPVGGVTPRRQTGNPPGRRFIGKGFRARVGTGTPFILWLVGFSCLQAHLHKECTKGTVFVDHDPAFP